MKDVTKHKHAKQIAGQIPSSCMKKYKKTPELTINICVLKFGLINQDMEGIDEKPSIIGGVITHNNLKVNMILASHTSLQIKPNKVKSAWKCKLLQ